MKMLCETIGDLRTIQSKYPESSRGYESLRLAIIILERAVEIEEAVSPHWVDQGAGSPHWVAGQGAGSVNPGITASVSSAVQNPGACSGTITVNPPSYAWLTLED
jgi:hypothetical protein